MHEAAGAPLRRPARFLQKGRIRADEATTWPLAEVWQEPQQCQAALDKLLCDGRKGRKGFPDAVRHELIALRSWTETF